MRCFLCLFVMLTAFLFFGCSSNRPSTPECITAFDCADGYTCQDEKCVALPDDVVVVDKDVAATDGATDESTEETPDDLTPDESLPDENTDDEYSPDEFVPDEGGNNDEDDLLSDDDTPADTTPPTVVSTSPANNATNVGIATTIEVTFSEPMKETTLTTATIQVKQGATIVSGTVTYTAGTYTAVFTPGASLTYDKTYTVTVTIGAKDVAGNGLAASHIFSFTTATEEINECAPDNKGPCDDSGDTAATCTDTVGSYTCNCTPLLFTFSGGTCQDVDECLSNNGNCDINANCENTVGGRTCTCKTHYTWNGTACVADTQTFYCAAKPANSVWNTVSDYEQTWTGTSWYPPDSTTTYSTTPSTTACRFKCLDHYTWNSGTGTCDADTQTFTCAAKPANSQWNTVGSYTQTWTGSGWSPTDSTTTYNTSPSSTECRFKCLDHYTWNSGTGTCNADTQTFTCAAKPATGTEWNTVSQYSQTWNGSGWTPPDSTTTYNETPSDIACRYKCATDYHWSGSACVSNSKTYICNAKPASNTEWNTVSQYAQTWTGSAWNPADDPTTEYNDTASDTSCRFKCVASYHWDGSACVSNTRTFSCAAKPANTDWNTVSGYTQNWTGSAWSPTDSTTSYNETPSDTSCRYKCASNYYWSSSACVQCLNDTHCGGGTPHCLLSNNTCVACRDNNDCNTGAGEVCSPVTHTCAANVCGDGVLGGTIPAFTEGFESGVRPSYSDGDEWSIATDQKYAGTYSLKSNNVYWADDTRSIYFVKYTDGQICFWHRSTSIWYGEFRVYVDGSSKYSKTSSQSSWTQQCISVSAGYREVEFRFSISSDSGSGNWYIDDIRFYNATTEQCDGGSTTCGNLGFDCGSGVSCGSDCTWQAGEADCHDDGGCGC